MKIHILWTSINNRMPWALDAIDEYTLEENGDAIMSALKHAQHIGHDLGNLRWMIVEIDEDAVHNLFEPPTVKGEVLGDSA